MKKTTPQSILAVIMIAVTTVFMGAAQAAVVDWDGGGTDSNWTTDANWVGDNAPAVGDDVQFNSTGPGVVQVDPVAGVNVGSMRIYSDDWTLQGNQIAINPSGSYATYDIYLPGLRTQIDSNLELQGDIRFDMPNHMASSDRTVINGVISEDDSARALELLGGHTTRRLSLRGANTYSGGTTLGIATLEVGDNAALGTGSFTVGGGGIWVTKDIELENAVSLTGDMILGRFAPLAGTLTLNGPISIDAAGVNIEEFDNVNDKRLELAGTITDNGNGLTLTTQHKGEILLGSANDISGDVTWVAAGSGHIWTADDRSEAGKLALGHENALGSGTLHIDVGTNKKSGVIFSEAGHMTIEKDIVVEGTGANIGIGGSSGTNMITLAGEFSSSGGSFATLSVNTGSTLAAEGTISATTEVQIGGSATLAPGNTGNYATLTIDGGGDLEFVNDTTTFQVDLRDAVPGTGHDQVIVNGDVFLDKAQLVLNLDDKPRFEDTDLAFILVNNGPNPISGDYNSIFDGLSDGATISLGTVLGQEATAQISYFGDFATGDWEGGNDIVLYNFTNAFVPEPSAALLLLLGGVALIHRRRVG